jgi:hypothetical protein
VKVPVAVNCCVLPRAIETGCGVNAIETRLGSPVPVRETVCGVLLALSLKVSVALLAPVALGEKVTDTVQRAPAANVCGDSGHPDATTKSLKLLAMLVMVSAVDWLLVSVTDWAALVVPVA